MADLNALVLNALKEDRATDSMLDEIDEDAEDPSWFERHLGPGSSADSFATGAFNSLTGNFLDEMSAALSALGGGDYNQVLEQERARQQSAQEAHPMLYAGGELAGAVAPALATGGAAAGTSLLGAAGKAAGTSALQSGISGFGEGEGAQDRLARGATDATIGGILGGALGSTARFWQKGKKAAVEHAKRVGTNAFYKAKNEAYDAVSNSDIVMDPATMRDMVADMKQRVSTGMFDPRLNKEHKKIVNLIKQVEQVVDPSTRKGAKRMITQGTPPPDSIMTLGQLEDYRQTLNRAWRKSGKDPRIMELRKAVDGAIDQNPEALELVQNARKLDMTYNKSKLLDKIVDDVQRETKSTYAGTNLNNKYRQAFTKVLKNEKLASRFSPEEKVAMQKLIEQGGVENALRLVGRVSPANGGLMTVLNVGLANMNPALLGFGAVGETARRAGDRITENMVDELRSQIAGHTIGPVATRPSAVSRGAIAEGTGDLTSLLLGSNNAPDRAAEQPNLPLLDELIMRKLAQ